MKNFRRSLAFLLMATMVMSLSMSVASAAEPRYVPCPEGGKHMMRQCLDISGNPLKTTSYDGSPSSSLNFKNGYTNQCSGCYLVIASQNNPRSGTMGKYVTENPGYSISGSHSTYKINGTLTGTITSSSGPDSITGGMNFV